MKKKIEARLGMDTTTVTTRLPDTVVHYIQRQADRQLRTRSDVLREIVITALRSSGIVAQPEDELNAA